MKLIKQIVNDKHQVVGFVVTGKQSEFGGVGSEMVTGTLSYQRMFETKFRNSQVAIMPNGCIEELNGFKIKSLPMMENTAKGLVDVDNTIKLMSRILIDGALKGFGVIVGGKESKLCTADVIRLASWYNTVNFDIRTTGDNKFIAGKPGTRIEELPAVELYTGAKQTKKKSTVSKSDDVRKPEMVTAKAMDILQLFETLDNMSGIVAKKDNKVYNKIGATTQQVSDAFSPLNFGEIMRPAPVYTESKLNVSGRFRKPGVIMINVNGASLPVYTYVNTTKTIFHGGKINMEKVAIGIDVSKKDEVQKLLSSCVGFEEVKDEKILKPLSDLTYGRDRLCMYDVDVSTLSIMSEARAKESILDAKKIYDMIVEIENHKLVNKLVNAMTKAIESQAVADGWEDKREKFGLYATMNDSALSLMEEAGIDIYSGAYTAREAVSNDGTSSGKGKATTSDDVEIIYSIKGLDIAKIKAGELIEYVDLGVIPKTHPLLDLSKLRDVKSRLNGCNSVSAYDTLIEIKKESEKKLSANRKAMWMHNMGMFVAGKGSVHTLDRQLWVEKATRKAGAKAYGCIVSGLEDLTVTLVGVDM